VQEARTSETTAGAAVEVREITKRYGDRVALDAVSFTVPAGVVGLLGPNGAGKTTLMRILTTILEPTAGTFTVAGCGQAEAGEIRRRIGVLPEKAGYPRVQTGGEYLTYHGRLFGLHRTQATAAARRALESVGLAERGRSLIGSYSRGMLQRLGIARALVTDPSVVFLDEPTIGLDPAGRRDILETIRRLSREHGATILLSSHQLADVEEICDRAVILNRGRVVSAGTVAGLVRGVEANRRLVVVVPADRRAEALAHARAAPNVQHVHRAADHPSGITVVFEPGVDPDVAGQAVLRTLLDAGIAIRRLEAERGTLSEAFLAATEADDR
jgi:ABC-2 type transport system ATP-binding protein